MRLLIFFILFIIASSMSNATGVAVVPDRLIFDGEEETFKILNPNEEIMEFSITGELSCTPEEGDIAPKSNAEIHCNADDDSPQISAILVETALTQDGSVSMIPAIAIGAQIIREKDKEVAKNNLSLENKSPLIVEDITSTKISRIKNTISDMKTEIISIIALIIAISAVLTYTEIKKRRKIIGYDGTLRRDVPSCQSSATGEASPGQQKQGP